MVSIIIPTLNAEKYIYTLIKNLNSNVIIKHCFDIIIIDSNSRDKTQQICKEIINSYSNVSFYTIGNEKFDHGGTRNLAARNSNSDILVFMTQDAIPANKYFLEELIKPFSDPNVSAVYGRQIARKNATPIEKFTRQFNYPNKDKIKTKYDIKKLGIKTFFCTNVCSAFRAEDFWEYSGFPEKTILNEDMIMASKLILGGKKVVYASKAKVIHSHNYTYWQQFTRNFDIGVSLKQNKAILKYAKPEFEGLIFVKKAIKYLFKIKKPYLILDLILESGFKFLGYKFGIIYDKLPICLVKKFSMYKSYWN